MRTSLNVLDNLHVASPCHAEWDEMLGDDRSRFCGSCEKHVYNLSEMSKQEALNLVQEKEGNLCVRFYRRHDETMMTSDCPVGVHHRIQRRKRTAGIFASVASLLFMTGCRDEAPDSKPDEATPFEQLLVKPRAGRDAMIMGEPVVMGKICVPEPAVAQPAPQPE